MPRNLVISRKENSMKELIKKQHEECRKAYESLEDKASAAALQLLGAMGAYENLCPELKESEDERIRRELTSLFEDGIKGISHRYTGEDCGRWLAWLKNQGEPTDIPADMANTPKEEYQKGWDAAMRQLPKEVDSQVWQIANNSAKTFEESFAILCATQKAYDKGKKDALKEQNHAWSEEDESKIKGIINTLEGLCDSATSDTTKDLYIAKIDWLKSIKCRVQPKQEWSDNDEKRMNHIIQFLEDKDRWKDSERAFPIEEDIRWLKDLKPQNRWKPTAAQMYALKQEVENKIYSGGDIDLSSLYHDLTKLL